MFYCLGNVIYKCPALSDIYEGRLARAPKFVNEAFAKLLAEREQFDPICRVRSINNSNSRSSSCSSNNTESNGEGDNDYNYNYNNSSINSSSNNSNSNSNSMVHSNMAHVDERIPLRVVLRGFPSLISSFEDLQRDDYFS